MTDVQLVLSGVVAASDEAVLTWLRALGRVPAARRLLIVDRSALSATLREAAGTAEILLAADRLPNAVTLHGRAGDLPSPRSLVLLALSASSDDPVIVAPGWSGDDLVRAGAVHPAAPHAVRNADTLAEALAAGAATGVTAQERPGTWVVPNGAADPKPAVGDPQPPYGHPAALPATTLHRLLTQSGLGHPTPADDSPRPFLTVVTRTQGTRLLCLEEALTCLGGQTVRDLELIVAAHRVAPNELAGVRATIHALPTWLQQRTTLIEVGRPGRSAPLNDALAIARGRYVAVLDDDDLVTPTWVETFAGLERSAPGTVLRAATLRQDVVRTDVEVDERTEVVAARLGPAHPGWPAVFSMVDHLVDNETPVLSLAIPRGVFADLGERFDEDLDTTEDWDLLLRAAGVAGVTSSTEPTSIYRIWASDEGSRSTHASATWQRGHERVRARLADRLVVLDGAEAQGLVAARDELNAEVAEKHRIAALNEQAAADLVAVNEAVVALREQLAQAEAARDRARARLKRAQRQASAGKQGSPARPDSAARDDAGPTDARRWGFRRQR